MNQQDLALIGELFDVDMDDLYLEGEDDDDDDDIGARARRGGRRPRGRAPSARKRLAKQLISAIPGVPSIGMRRFGLSFPLATFNAAQGLAPIVVQASPQKPFKGIRLGIVEARSGPTATGLIVINRLDMGVDFQGVNVQPQPAAMFGPTAFDTSLFLSPIQPGVQATLSLGISLAPTAPDQVDVSAMIIGVLLSS